MVCPHTAVPLLRPRGSGGGPFPSASAPALGPQPHCCHGDEYPTESSRGSDLSDITEEDEEELHSEMQLEDGGRRRPGGPSHGTLKVSAESCSCCAWRSWGWGLVAPLPSWSVERRQRVLTPGSSCWDRLGAPSCALGLQERSLHGTRAGAHPGV